MKYDKETVHALLGERVKILVNGNEYPKQIAGVITQVRNKTFVFRPFGLKQKLVFRYDQLVSVAEPGYIFDIMKMQ